jgi:2-dehydro-3-deoxygalactonokinase
MTGELFALLGAHSVLRHGIASAGWQEEAFAAAVTETLARPERLAADLFGLRAAGLLHGLDGETARARLSGLLIGAELAAARPYWLGQDVLVIGAEEVSGAYRAALALQGVTAGTVPGRDAVLAGLAIVAAGFLKGSTV